MFDHPCFEDAVHERVFRRLRARDALAGEMVDFFDKRFSYLSDPPCALDEIHEFGRKCNGAGLRVRMIRIREMEEEFVSHEFGPRFPYIVRDAVVMRRLRYPDRLDVVRALKRHEREDELACFVSG